MPPPVHQHQLQRGAHEDATNPASPSTTPAADGATSRPSSAGSNVSPQPPCSLGHRQRSPPRPLQCGRPADDRRHGVTPDRDTRLQRRQRILRHDSTSHGRSRCVQVLIAPHLHASCPLTISTRC
jgi:hypothetical protein